LLRAVRRGSGGGRRLVVNAHVDVVPADVDRFPSAFTPVILPDRIIGRGVVDTKGNLVMLVEAIRMLLATGGTVQHDIILDLVREEEIGGSGALASALVGIDADVALVLEPTDLEVFHGHRGCVTFQAEFSGNAVHMGNDLPPVSAIDLAIAGIAALGRHEAAANAVARKHNDYARWNRAVQVNVGRIEGGEWYGSVAARCTIAGNCGFCFAGELAATKETLCAVLREAISDVPGATVDVTFPGLNNEAYATPSDDPFCQAVMAAAGATTSSAWNVSCDGRHYGRTLGLPTVIFGCGSLAEAHSDHETLVYDDLFAGIMATAKLLAGSLGANNG
jgi:acetylornithine deacetylase